MCCNAGLLGLQFFQGKVGLALFSMRRLRRRYLTNFAIPKFTNFCRTFIRLCCELPYEQSNLAILRLNVIPTSRTETAGRQVARPQ